MTVLSRQGIIFFSVIASAVLHFIVIVPIGASPAGETPSEEKGQRVAEPALKMSCEILKVLNQRKEKEQVTQARKDEEPKPTERVQASFNAAPPPQTTPENEQSKSENNSSVLLGRYGKEVDSPAVRIDCSDFNAIMRAISSGDIAIFLLIQQNDRLVFFEVGLQRGADGRVLAKRGGEFEYSGAFEMYRLPPVPRFQKILNEITVPQERARAHLVLGIHQSLARRMQKREKSFCSENQIDPTKDVIAFLCELQEYDGGWEVGIRAAILKDGTEVR